MKPRSIDRLLEEHAFFAGMEHPWLEFISGCGRNVVLDAGTVVAQVDQAAERFFAVRRGRLAIEVYSPERGALTLQTVGDGGVVGWSWIFPPYRWVFDVRAVKTTHAVEFDGTCLREKCEQDPKMGYEFMKRFARVLTGDLQAARMQLLDVYGGGETNHGSR